MSKKFFLILSLLLLTVNLASEAQAEIGVGVGLGQIKVREVLIPGGIYNLPPIPVVNTGDEKTNYSMEIGYVLGQGWNNPHKSWFGFDPKTFVLEPERSVMVHPRIKLPLEAQEGEYFAFIEARALPETEGPVVLGPAAATKLYLSIGPSPGVLGAVRQRFFSYYVKHLDLLYLLAAALCLLLACLILKRRFEIEFKVKPKDKRSSQTPQQQPPP